MRSPKALALGAAACALGFTAGWFSHARSTESLAAALAIAQTEVKNQVEARANMQERLAEIEHGLGSIARIDLGEILKIQDAESRATKLGEIVGDLFVLLLNQALLPTTPARVAAVERLAGNSKIRIKSDYPAQEPSKAIVPPERSGPEVNQSTTDSTPSPPGAAGSTANWREAEAKLDEVTTANADAFLAKAAIQDLSVELKNGRPFKPNDTRLNFLQGNFSGDVKYLDPKKESLTMELELTVSGIEEGKVMGTFAVRLFNNGSNNSTSNGHGNLGDEIMNTSTESAAIIIKVSPDQFAQIYYLAASDMLIGNLYELSGTKAAKLIGHVKLNR